MACLPERSSLRAVRTTSSPRRDLPGGPETAHDVALLEALGVIDAERRRARRGSQGIPTDAEVRAWTGRLQAALHRSGCDSPVSGALARRATFARHLVASACWSERAERLLAPGDAEYLSQAEDTGEAGPRRSARPSPCSFTRGCVSPAPDNTLRPDAALTRAGALALLAGVAEKAGAPGLAQGELAGLAEGSLSVLHGEAADSHPLDPGVRLFRDLDGVHAGASELTLSVGERVVYVERDGRVVYLEAEQTPPGRRGRPQLALLQLGGPHDPGRGGGGDRPLRLRRHGPRHRAEAAGRLRARGGARGRGRRGASSTSRGCRCAGAWACARTSSSSTARRARAATIERFVITGKGWGHGVGLCQVGAFGMAQAGSTFDEILKHYYTGISLSRRIRPSSRLTAAGHDSRPDPGL